MTTTLAEAAKALLTQLNLYAMRTFGGLDPRIVEAGTAVRAALEAEERGRRTSDRLTALELAAAAAGWVDHGWLPSPAEFRQAEVKPTRPGLRLVPPPASDALAAFLAGLTALSDDHGIAINEGAELYVMEPDDRMFFTYHADADSRLKRA